MLLGATAIPSELMHKDYGILLGILSIQVIFFTLFGGYLYPISESFFYFRQRWELPFFQHIHLPFGDLMYIVLGFFLVKIILKKNWKILCKWILFLYPIYQICWGLMYFRTPLEKSLRLSDFYIKENQVKESLRKHIENAYFLRKNINVKLYSYEKIRIDFKQSLFHTPALAEISFQKILLVQPVKVSLFSSVMPWTGILGYFNPFTIEANISDQMPVNGLPITLGHEWAHLLGIAREQEANFVGWWIARHSKNLFFQYSAELMCVKSLLRALPAEDYKIEFEKLPTLVKNDLLAEKKFWEQHQNPIQNLFSIMNDWFLKLNGQDGAVTYSYFTRILLAWEAKYSRID